jgi:hypothetical protein
MVLELNDDIKSLYPKVPSPFSMGLCEIPLLKMKRSGQDTKSAHGTIRVKQKQTNCL